MATNWRMQQLLYRANYDAYVQDRARRDARQKSTAVADLQSAPRIGANAALEQAETILAPEPVCTQNPLCERATSLAGDLFRTVRMQLSVTRFGALAVDRGANLDRIDAPIGDRLWLLDQIASAEQRTTEEDKRRSIAATLAELELVGNFAVDDLSPFGEHPHLILGNDFFRDPSGLTGVYFSVNTTPPQLAEPLFERTFAGTLYDQPLRMHYTNLTRGAKYHVHVVYPSAGDSFHIGFQIRANWVTLTQRCAHPDACTESDIDIPRDVTSSGELTLEWSAPPGLGCNGQFVKVSRVVLSRMFLREAP